MKKQIVLLGGLCLLLGLGSTGCMGVATPAMGVLLTDVKWDGGTHGKQGSKTGRACATSVLALVSSGDASVEAAAKNGGITTVTGVDHESKWTLLFGEYCTIVRGN